MSLYERLLGLSGTKIPVHQFMAGCAEVRRSQMTRGQLFSIFSLDAKEKLQLSDVVSRITATLNPLTAAEIHDTLLLAEEQMAYSSVSSLLSRWGL